LAVSPEGNGGLCLNQCAKIGAPIGAHKDMALMTTICNGAIHWMLIKRIVRRNGAEQGRGKRARNRARTGNRASISGLRSRNSRLAQWGSLRGNTRSENTKAVPNFIFWNGFMSTTT
jgi:hypothetical protein